MGSKALSKRFTISLFAKVLPCCIRKFWESYIPENKNLIAVFKSSKVSISITPKNTMVLLLMGTLQVWISSLK